MQRRENLAVQFYNRNHNTTLSLESFDPVSALYDEFKQTEFAKQGFSEFESNNADGPNKRLELAINNVYRSYS